MDVVRLIVRLPRSLKEAAQMKAGMKDLTLSQVVRRLLRAWTTGRIELVEMPGEED